MEKLTVRSLYELDAIVAEKVMGWQNVAPVDNNQVAYLFCDRFNGNPPQASQIDSPVIVPSYSKSLDAAWEVVDRLRNSPYWCSVAIDADSLSVLSPNLVQIEIEMWKNGDPTFQYTESATAPIAICLAALKTIGIEVELTIE